MLKYFDSRKNWQTQARELGLNVSLLVDPPYWVEALAKPFCLEYTTAQIEAIQKATDTLHSLCQELIGEICSASDSSDRLTLLSIPHEFHTLVRQSFERADKSLYGRFDLVVDGESVKLLEINFDTPTGLAEAAVLQLVWLADLKANGTLPQSAEQYNYLQEDLLNYFGGMSAPVGTMRFAYHSGADHDAETVLYLRACAEASKLASKVVTLDQIKMSQGLIVDQDGPIHWIFKLYPWEMLLADDQKIKTKSGNYLFSDLISNQQLIVMEPVWKAIVSSKAFLALLFERYPHCPYLIPTYFADQKDKLGNNYVRKPFFGREGAGVSIHKNGTSTKDEEFFGPYGDSESHHIYQDYIELPQAAGYNLCVGSWLIAGQPSGISIRADKSLITGQNAVFIPHFVTGH